MSKRQIPLLSTQLFDVKLGKASESLLCAGPCSGLKDYLGDLLLLLLLFELGVWFSGAMLCLLNYLTT